MNDARPIEEPIIVPGSIVEPSLPAELLTVAPRPVSVAPEFDTYLALVKLALGGAIEGTAEVARRLERLEAELRASEAGPPPPGEVTSTADVLRYLVFGATLSAADGLRRRAVRWAEASDVWLRRGGSAVAPLAGNRLTRRVVGPFDRAFNRRVARGQQRVNEWVELGRAHEPTARLLARRAYLEAVDDFIYQLSENDELADLVQQKSIGLANEVVEEVRERTVSADTLAESLVRRILRRPPREALPLPPDALRQAVAEPKRGATHEP